MKKYFIIPILFLFLGCSIIAKSVENGELTASTWYGYYNYNEKPDFNNLSFFQFKINEKFISIKSGNYSLKTGEPIQSSAGSYKITKTLKNTPEEYQVLIIDALADSPVERILGLKKTGTDFFVSEPKLWEEGMDTTTLKYSNYLYSKTYMDLLAVDPNILDPSEVVLFDTFLEKVTGGKDSETWLITQVAADIVGATVLNAFGMGVGSEMVLFKEYEKNPDGTPKLDKHKQRIWGYAHGKKKVYSIYYKPIPVADSENKYGVYWVQGNWIFGRRPLQIPVMIHESMGINRAFAGTVNGFTGTADWDAGKHWLWLDSMGENDLNALISGHGFIERATPIKQ